MPAFLNCSFLRHQTEIPGDTQPRRPERPHPLYSPISLNPCLNKHPGSPGHFCCRPQPAPRRNLQFANPPPRPNRSSNSPLFPNSSNAAPTQCRGDFWRVGQSLFCHRSSGYCGCGILWIERINCPASSTRHREKHKKCSGWPGLHCRCPTDKRPDEGARHTSLWLRAANCQPANIGCPHADPNAHSFAYRFTYPNV